MATTYNVVLAFFVALGSFTYGFNSSIMGTVLGLESFYSYFGLSSSQSSSSSSSSGIIGATNGLYSAGGFIGCCLVSWPADKFGRKRTVQLICLICIISAVIQAGSVHVAMLLVGRFLNGMGSGMMNVVVPIYQSEIAPRNSRGRLVGAHGFLIVTGYALAGWTGVGCYFEQNPRVQWRLCLGLQVVAPMLLLLGSPRIPESPRWLLGAHREESALEVLRALHGSPEVNEEAGAQEELSLIQAQLEYEASQKTGFIHALKAPSSRKRLLIGFFVQAIAQSTGVLVINNYQVILYSGLGLSGYLPLMLYALYASWCAFLNWAGSMVVDRLGRVKMLAFGCVGCAFMIAGEAAMVAVFGGSDNKIGNGFGVFFFFGFGFFYGGCVDAISYVYCSELFPTNLRAKGMGFSVAALFLMTLAYTQPAPTAFAQIGWHYYLIFIILSLAGAPIMLFMFPETKGLTLEEIGTLFGDHDGQPECTPDESAKDKRSMDVTADHEN